MYCDRRTGKNKFYKTLVAVVVISFCVVIVIIGVSVVKTNKFKKILIDYDNTVIDENFNEYSGKTAITAQVINDEENGKTPEFTEETESTEEAGTPDMESWRSVYINFLNEHESEIRSCGIARVDNDDIPELFICAHEIGHAIGITIYTIVDNEVQLVGEHGCYGGISVFEGYNLLMDEDIGMGAYYITYLSIDSDKKLSQVVQLLIDNCDIEGSEEYYIDGNRVSEEELNNKKSEIEPSQDLIYVGGSDGLDVHTLIHKLEDYDWPDYEIFHGYILMVH